MIFRSTVVWVLLISLFFVQGDIFENFFNRVGVLKKKNSPLLEEPPKVEQYHDVYPSYWQEPDCQAVEDRGRYLLMSKRNGGWNNERMILENAIIMAWVTNRTLVIPYDLKYNHMHGEESFERFLDLTYARCFVPIITSNLLPKLTNGAIDQKYEGAETYSEAHTFTIEYNIPEVPPEGSPHRAEFDTFRMNRKIANQLPSPNQQPGYRVIVNKERHRDSLKIIIFENDAKFLNSKKPFFCLFYVFYWFEDKQQHNQMLDIIKHGAHYHLHFWNLAYKVLKNLGPPGTFSTMHIRARDFRHKGGYYSHFKSASWIDSMTQFHSTTFRKGELVYISTDEKNMTDIENFQRDLKEKLGVDSTTIYDFFGKLNIDSSVVDRRWEFWGKQKLNPDDAKQFNLNDLGAVEQIICAHGRRFIGTYFSTFTAHIMRLRGYLPFEPIVSDEHLFWDRSLPQTQKCGFHSAPESCDPSWAGQFAGSLWASEFEEGWLPFGEVKSRKAQRKLNFQENPHEEDQQVEVTKRSGDDWLSKRIAERLAHEKQQKHDSKRDDSQNLPNDVSVEKLE